MDGCASLHCQHAACTHFARLPNVTVTAPVATRLPNVAVTAPIATHLPNKAVTAPVARF